MAEPTDEEIQKMVLSEAIKTISEMAEREAIRQKLEAEAGARAVREAVAKRKAEEKAAEEQARAQEERAKKDAQWSLVYDVCVKDQGISPVMVMKIIGHMKSMGREPHEAMKAIQMAHKREKEATEKAVPKPEAYGSWA